MTTTKSPIGADMARSLVQALGDDCGGGAVLAAHFEGGMQTIGRGAALEGLNQACIARAAGDFTARGWLMETAAGWQRTDAPLPSGLAAFLSGAETMRASRASEADAIATAVVTLPAAPSTIAGKLPTEGPIHARLGRTEEVLEEISRAAVTSFTVMSPFVNHDGAEFAIHLFEQTGASQRTLITRLSGTTRLAIQPLRPALRTLGVRVLSYLLPAGDGYETFHAKIVIADADQAYVGSANMTRYARHSMEVGVVLKGRPARAVSALVRAVERISRPAWPD